MLLTLTIAHLEKAKTVFAVERLPVEGEFAMSFQFTDGAEYRVTAIAYVTGGQMIRTEQNISVIGVEPPARADDSRDRVFSRGDCVRFGSWKMEPPGDQQGRAVIKEFNHKELKGRKVFQ